MRYVIKQFLTDAECELSGKTGEAVVVESDDGLTDAVISFAQLQKVIRFRAKQETKANGGNGRIESVHRTHQGGGQ